jgi:hypothetical protein
MTQLLEQISKKGGTFFSDEKTLKAIRTRAKTSQTPWIQRIQSRSARGAIELDTQKTDAGNYTRNCDLREAAARGAG